MTRENQGAQRERPAFRTIEGWAISILLEAGAICECEEHGRMKDRTDPRARQRAIEIARQYPPLTVSLAHATAAVESVLGSIGDACPELPAGRRLTVGTVPLMDDIGTASAQPSSIMSAATPNSRRAVSTTAA